VKRDDAVLVPGCGNSRLPEDMAEDGYRSIHNIDISAVVIEQQRERYQGHPHERFISFQHMNACALEFPDETFDAVIAKVGRRALFLATGARVRSLSRRSLDLVHAGARRRRDVWRGARGERREHVHGGAAVAALRKPAEARGREGSSGVSAAGGSGRRRPPSAARSF
jgi:SAM-dependent methyltransferase